MSIGEENIKTEILDVSNEKSENPSKGDNEIGYWGGKQLPQSALRTASALGIIGALGASLTACNNSTNSKDSNARDDFLSSEQYSGDTGSSSAEIRQFVKYDEARWESVERWPTLEPLETENVNEIIETTGNSQVILLPVKNDYFYNDKQQPSLIEIPAGTNLKIEKIFSFTGEGDQIVRFAVLPNVMGSKSIPIILLDNGHIEDDKYFADHRNYKKNNEKEVSANFSYLVGADEVYPNKVSNILIAMEHLAKAQEERGMFTKGQEYSYLDLIALGNLDKFKDGFTSSKSIVRGGGVCAGATLLSNTLYELGKQKNVPWEEIVQEKWAHPSMYFLSPFVINDFVTDATVELSKDDQRRSYDFRWIQPENAYLEIDISLAPNNINQLDIDPSGIGGRSDVEFMITLSFTKNNPGNQSEKIREFIDAYENYRVSGYTFTPSLLQELQPVKELSWGDPTLQVVRDYIYPEEKVASFSTELMQKGEALNDIDALGEIVNTLPEDFSGNIGDYLMKSAWYSDKKENEDLEGALKMLNYTNVEGQPLQCVGFVVLLSALTKDDFHIQNVGGARSFGNGLSSAKTATELIPLKLLEDEYLPAASTGYGGIALASKEMSIGDYKVGDLFVRADIGGYNDVLTRDGSNITFQTGHIGAIIGRKIVNGEIILLVADSNRKNDGKIMIFEVTEHNFYKIFGDPGVRKYIIRSAENAGN